jgi:hypothetical protein
MVKTVDLAMSAEAATKPRAIDGYDLEQSAEDFGVLQLPASRGFVNETDRSFV